MCLGNPKPIILVCKIQSQAIAWTTARLALALNFLVGRSLMGMAANTNLVHHVDFAMVLLHIQISISWFVLNCAPSVNHLTLTQKISQKESLFSPKQII